MKDVSRDVCAVVLVAVEAGVVVVVVVVVVAVPVVLAVPGGEGIMASGSSSRIGRRHPRS